MKYVYGLMIVCCTLLAYFNKAPYAVLLSVFTLILQQYQSDKDRREHENRIASMMMASLPTKEDITAVPTGDEK